MKHLFYWLCLGQLILTLNNNVAAQDCPIPITIDTIKACAGAPITLTVNPQLPEGVTATYAWSGPAGTSVHQNPTIANMTSAKAGIYTITVTYSNNCIATASTIVFCNYRPTITAVAHNDTIIVSAHSNPVAHGVEYSLNNGAFQSDSVFVVACPGTYTVIARDLITGCTQSTYLLIAIGNSPTTTAVAHNDTIIVSAHSNPVEHGVEYSLNDGAFQSDSVFVVGCNGYYNITARDLVTGCTRTITVSVVFANPLPTITAVAYHDTIIVSAHSNPVQNGVEYSLNNGAFQSDSVFVVCCSGNYNVTTRDLITGCTETIWLTCVNCAPAFIADETVVSPFNIYPNPANNQITVSKLMSKDIELLLYDITGKLIYQQVLQEKNTDISVQHLTIGVYYCKIDNTVFKLLITK